MRWAPLRWLANNVGTLMLAFILAVVVWVSAVVTADPNERHTFRPVPIEIIGQDPDLLLFEGFPAQASLTLVAPKSIWDRLNNNPDLVNAWIDLSGVGEGVHDVEVKTRVDASPVRFVQIDPTQVRLTLELLARRELPVQLNVSGELPLGYKIGLPSLQPERVTISGPKSEVDRVAQARLVLDVSGATETIHKTMPLELVDENGELVSGLTVTPRTLTVDQPISLLGGFKNVAVKVVTTGQVADGYRLTNIQVYPPTVTLFSDNPQLTNEILGYVETLPVDLGNLTDDTEISVGLNLPEGVTTVRDPNVLVQVNVAAMEGSLTLSVPVETIGLDPTLDATVSPATVDVIIAGPLNLLETLTPDSFLVVLDLTDLPPGVYQRAPVVESSPPGIRVQTTLPETVEVNIHLAPTPTPTATVSITPRPTLTLTPGVTLTPVPTP